MDDFELDEPTEAALARLRAADPASDVDGSWSESRAAGAALTTSPQPRRRTVTLLAAASAAVVVAALALAVTELRGSDPTPQAAGSNPPAYSTVTTSGVPTSGVPTTPPPGTVEPKEKTQALLASLLSSAPVLPGATSAATSPTPLLDDFGATSASPNEVHASTIWWTAPGTVEDALAYLRAHPPGGLTFGGSMSSGNDRTGERVDGLTWDYASSNYADDVEVQVAVTALDDGVAVSANARGIWIPTRDPATLLGDVTSVNVAIVRGNGRANEPFAGAPSVYDALDGSDAQSLADIVDGLHEDVSGLHSCPLAAPNFDDEFDFTTSDGRTVHVVATISGCAGVTLTLAGGDELHLVAGTLNAKALELVGRPDDYGFSN